MTLFRGAIKTVAAFSALYWLGFSRLPEFNDWWSDR